MEPYDLESAEAPASEQPTEQPAEQAPEQPASEEVPPPQEAQETSAECPAGILSINHFKIIKILFRSSS